MDRRTSVLPYGKQRLLEIALALAAKPRVLLLDEPLEGLAPIIVQELLAVLQQIIRDEGMSVILVEQNARKALGITHDAIVLERGSAVHAAPAKTLLDDPGLLDGLLGVARH